MGHHYFICYSKADGKQIARRLADDLLKTPPSIQVWLDERELQPGPDWDDQIVNALRECTGLIFVMTADSVHTKSECKREWSRALHYKKPIIPLLFNSDAEIPYRLEPRQYIDFTSSYNQALATLRSRLQWCSSPEGLLHNLKQRLLDAERDLPRAKDNERSRIEDEIIELKREITSQKHAISNPDAAAVETEKRIDSGLERERQPLEPVHLETDTKFINPPPARAPAWFQDRDVETGLVGVRLPGSTSPTHPKQRYDIFLSYSRQDIDRARWFIDLFEGKGLSVFWDLTSIPPGTTFHQFIRQSLNRSCCVVVLWTDASVKSKWVDIEAREGEKRSVLFPVLLDELKEDELPFGLHMINATDLHDWDGRSSHCNLDLLLQTLHARLGKEEAAIEEESKRKEEEQRKAEEEAERVKAKEEAAKREATLEAKRKADEEKSKRAEEEAKRKAEADKRRLAEQETQRKIEEARKSEEEAAKRRAEEAPASEIGDPAHPTVPPANSSLPLAKITALGGIFVVAIFFALIMLNEREPATTTNQRLVGEMIPIKGGCFQMGSPADEESREGDERQHRVCVGDFKIGKTEVTQQQWREVMGNNPSLFKDCDDCPVEQVSWNNVQDFLQKLNVRSGMKFRLPTEAEWEYAARAGTTGPFSFQDNISDDKVNYNAEYTYGGSSKGKYRGKTVPVGSLPANPWGLHEVHGNVWEWTCSADDENYGGSEEKCAGRNDSGLRVLRGGSWFSTPRSVRSAYRSRLGPDFRNDGIGFRLAQD